MNDVTRSSQFLVNSDNFYDIQFLTFFQFFSFRFSSRQIELIFINKRCHSVSCISKITYLVTLFVVEVLFIRQYAFL